MNFSLIWSEPSKTTFERVIVCLFIGVVVAQVMIVFDRTYIGKLVRRLLKKGANNTESALLLKECGLSRNPFIRLALRRSDSTLRKTVFCTEEKKVLKSEDFKTARFYIVEENVFNAEERFKTKNNGVFTLLAMIVFLFFALVAVVKYFPKIVELFNK